MRMYANGEIGATKSDHRNKQRAAKTILEEFLEFVAKEHHDKLLPFQNTEEPLDSWMECKFKDRPRDALSYVYTIFIHWCFFNRGVTLQTSRKRWISIRSVMNQRFVFVKKSVFAYFPSKLEKSKRFKDLYRSIKASVGPPANEERVWRPFLPQMGNLLSRFTPISPDGIRMRAFLLVAHRAKAPIQFW